ncbi:PspC domain-containing protein [Pelagicoccus sp. SDUM812003]|uniref:PspC domain-containing protein n=1 Tax=Pelagicoccus sp. SDUM812003 TaxID=3041267 RepID=UPI00280CE27B|nr:PspC domain-containing protein [Pelagicoccus sp. SDUM812003]MDQ8202731.1 PspC domain-containing protein [Pelagicoccus sp. SDUM812003]
MSKPLYRSKNRIVFGICQGLADHFDLSVVWIRLGLVAISLFTGFFPFPVLYAIAALIIKPEPEGLRREERSFCYEEDYFETSDSPRMLSLRRLKNRFDSIESRIRRMENYVTNKSYDWERRFNAGK